jgi:hypothetical protein
LKIIELKEYANLHAVTYRTAWNWYKVGKDYKMFRGRG